MGGPEDAALCRAVFDEELAKLRQAGDEAYPGGRYEDSAKLFRELIEARPSSNSCRCRPTR